MDHQPKAAVSHVEWNEESGTVMLVFIDESGDPGQKLDQGSSPFFSVVLVIFEDHAEALACDQRIELLRREINKPGMEFHFRRNSDTDRRAFLQAVAPYSFFYYSIVVDKSKLQHAGQNLTTKDSFYKYACGLVFENAKAKLDTATVIIDESGSLQFKRQLAQYLRRTIKAGNRRLIHKIKMQRSESNNLLQLADYVAGSINRSIQQKRKDAASYRALLAHREIEVQTWPK